MSRPTTTAGALWKLFLAALAIRWAYALALFAFMGDAGFLNEDAANYVARGNEFAAAIRAGNLHGLQWLGIDPVLMPLFYWLIAPHALLFGEGFGLPYVLTQGVLDAATCVLIYRIAHELGPRYALPSAICAVINPIQIVVSGIVFTDTPFLFFVVVFLLGAVRWLRAPSLGSAALLAIGLGGAPLVRILAAPWIVVVIALLLIATAATRRFTARNALGLLMVASVAACCVGLVLVRNVERYGAWSLTPEGGNHLALWVVPLVKETSDRTPWAETKQAMEAERQRRFGDVPRNPFREAEQYRTLGLEALHQLGVGATVKAWLTGIALNLGAPGILLSAPIYTLPRTGFFATRGVSVHDKVWNLLFRSDNALHGWIMLIGVAGVALVRALQLLGTVELYSGQRNRWQLSLLALWCLYILAINGPIPSPKYRLPIEPVLMVAAGAGIVRIRQIAKARTADRNAPAEAG